MSNYLANALGKKPNKLNNMLTELENSTGNPSEDVRLASDVVAKTKQKISVLGLDPNDTTAEELYGALNIYFKRQQELFLHTLGNHTDSDTIAEMFAHFETPGVWRPKSSFIKKALTQQPPKKLMKTLHYRTAESMMKRENPAKIAAAAGLCESPSWVSGFEQQIDRATASDWQIGPISILLYENSPWNTLPGKQVTKISCVAGSVILRPNMTSGSDIFCLTIKLFQAFESLVAQSQAVALKLMGKTKSYDLDTSRQVPSVKIGGLNLSLSAFELPVEDFETDEKDGSQNNKQKSKDIWQQFYQIHPALSWWKGNEDLLFEDYSGNVVSLNLIDVAINATNKLDFSNRILRNGQRKLEDSLASKYAEHSITGFLKKPPINTFASPQERLKQLQIRYSTDFAVGSIN